MAGRSTESYILTWLDRARGEEAEIMDNLRGPAAEPLEVDDSALRALVEGALFVNGDNPVMEWQLAKGLGQTRERIARALAALARECEKPERGLKAQAVAGGYRLTTKPELYDVVKHIARQSKSPREFSPAAIEALALIALKRPITLEQVNAIRGVESSGAIATLLERRVIAYVHGTLWNGRRIKPILLRTSRQFLVQFGLSGIDELPWSTAFARVVPQRAQNGTVEAEQRRG